MAFISNLAKCYGDKQKTVIIFLKSTVSWFSILKGGLLYFHFEYSVQCKKNGLSLFYDRFETIQFTIKCLVNFINDIAWYIFFNHYLLIFFSGNNTLHTVFVSREIFYCMHLLKSSDNVYGLQFLCYIPAKRVLWTWQAYWELYNPIYHSQYNLRHQHCFRASKRACNGRKSLL